MSWRERVDDAAYSMGRAIVGTIMLLLLAVPMLFAVAAFALSLWLALSIADLLDLSAWVGIAGGFALTGAIGWFGGTLVWDKHVHPALMRAVKELERPGPD
jgi:uncharacterized membrane protein